ncbi:protein rolling stone-like [Ctenocephalides felis]|uniref:protein rolling stone-like n=1 Tax=Ctenocephalides felis TaxID=7515 RepID=UPI000E6E3A47|nr:protein rolling stone-like [Ctenocephalides felis]
MGNWFKQEFQVNNFKFEHDAPEEFVVSQWQDESINWPHMVYRWMLGLFFFCLVVASWTLQEEGPELWLIYLTHWGIVFCCVQTLFAAVLVTYRHCQILKLQSVPYYEKMPPAYKFYWAAQTCTVTVAFGISIIYWTLLHSAQYNTVMNFMTHG